ncbi:MAG: hypothetical protein WCW33_05350 [Candidatus Babeliales bacterium]|jgi:hypothetical protein
MMFDEQNKKLFCLLIVLFLQVTGLCGQKNGTNGSREINTGQNITKPVRRFDVRYQYVKFPRESERHALIFRTDQPRKLSKKWELETRIDVPLICGTSARGGRRYKQNQYALSDIFMQAFATYHKSKRLAYWFGAQFLWPTAYRQCDGLGKYILSPMAGFSILLPEITRGSFFTFGMSYDFDYAGKSGYSHISRLNFQPTFQVMLTKKTFVTLYSVSGISYDFINKGFFLPLDITLGRMLGRSIVTTVELFTPLVYTNNCKPWNLRAQARIGLFF